MLLVFSSVLLFVIWICCWNDRVSCVNLTDDFSSINGISALFSSIKDFAVSLVCFLLTNEDRNTT